MRLRTRWIVRTPHPEESTKRLTALDGRLTDSSPFDKTVIHDLTDIPSTPKACWMYIKSALSGSESMTGAFASSASGLFVGYGSKTDSTMATVPASDGFYRQSFAQPPSRNLTLESCHLGNNGSTMTPRSTRPPAQHTAMTASPSSFAPKNKISLATSSSISAPIS